MRELRPILARAQVLSRGELALSASSAGQGNMNVTRRVRTNRRSLIVKTALPWVARYPEIPAPVCRWAEEADFYGRISRLAGVAERMPRLLGTDPGSRSLVLEDLGPLSDLQGLYRGQAMCPATLTELQAYLADLHACDSRPPMVNAEMRQLNHHHIFHSVFGSTPATDLDSVCPGLNQAGERIGNHPELARRADELGQVYLKARSGSLLHGDFYPGSWLVGGDGVKVIDPEFAFHGPPEFDGGVLVAHLLFAGQSPDLALLGLPWCDSALVLKFAGIEVLRRLLGVAQLPLEAGLEARMRWISVAEEWLLGD